MSSQLIPVIRNGRFRTFDGELCFPVAARTVKNDLIRNYERAAANGVKYAGPVTVETNAGRLSIDVALMNRASKKRQIVFDGLIAYGNKLKKATIVFVDEDVDVEPHRTGVMAFHDIALGVDIEVIDRATTTELVRTTSGGAPFITPVKLNSRYGKAEVAFAPTTLTGTADGLSLDGFFANGNKLGRASLKMVGDKAGRFVTRQLDAI